MFRTTLNALQIRIERGIAINATYVPECDEMPDECKKIAYSVGVYGINGILFEACKTKQLYVKFGSVCRFY